MYARSKPNQVNTVRTDVPILTEFVPRADEGCARSRDAATPRGVRKSTRGNAFRRTQHPHSPWSPASATRVSRTSHVPILTEFVPHARMCAESGCRDSPWRTRGVRRAAPALEGLGRSPPPSARACAPCGRRKSSTVSASRRFGKVGETLGKKGLMWAPKFGCPSRRAMAVPSTPRRRARSVCAARRRSSSPSTRMDARQAPKYARPRHGQRSVRAKSPTCARGARVIGTPNPCARAGAAQVMLRLRG